MLPSAQVLDGGPGSSKDAGFCSADSSSDASMHLVEEPGMSVAIVKVEEEEMAKSELEQSSKSDGSQDREDQWTEAEWRAAVRLFVDVTLFQVEQTRALLEDEEDESSSHDFLKLAGKLSVSDPVIAMLLMSIKQVAKDTDFTPETQKEFFNAVGDRVTEVLVKDIQSAGCFGVIFDTMCDTFETAQMSEVIRYVKINNRNVEVKEVFLGLLPIDGKNAADLGSDVLKNLESNGLDIMKCRAQGYDSATLMAGVHGGVRAILEGKNKKAIFNGFVDQSLNMCGRNCFCENIDFAASTVTLDKLFSLFADSTRQWDVFIAHTGASMERLPTTCWSAHYAAVKLVSEKFDGVVAALEAVHDSPSQADPRGEAGNLSFCVLDFPFLCFVNVWHEVLKEVTWTQQYLQSKSLTLDMVVKAIEALRLFLQEERGGLAKRAVEWACLKAGEYEIPVERGFRSKKSQRRNPGRSVQEGMKRVILECIDRFDFELRIRSRGLSEVAGMFEAVQVKSLLSATEEELKVSIPKLTTFFDELSGSELLKEIQRLRKYLRGAEIDPEEAKGWAVFDVLTRMAEWDFIELYPNLSISLKLFLTISVSAVSRERSFSKLKHIKDYLQSPMARLDITGLAMVLIENELVQDINFDELIDRFATLKAMEGKF